MRALAVTLTGMFLLLTGMTVAAPAAAGEPTAASACATATARLAKAQETDNTRAAAKFTRLVAQRCARTGTTSKPPVAAMDSHEQDVFTDVAQVRQNAGGGVLTSCRNLNAAASTWAQMLLTDGDSRPAGQITRDGRDYLIGDLLADTSGFAVDPGGSIQYWLAMYPADSSAMQSITSQSDEPAFTNPKQRYVGVGSVQVTDPDQRRWHLDVVIVATAGTGCR